MRRRRPAVDLVDVLLFTTLAAFLGLTVWISWPSRPPPLAPRTTTTTTLQETVVLDLDALCPPPVTTTTLAPKPCAPAKRQPCTPPSSDAVYRDRIAWLKRHPWRPIEGSCNWTNGMQTTTFDCQRWRESDAR